MYARSSEGRLAEINERISAPQYAALLVLFGIVLAIGVGFLNFWLDLPILFIFGVATHFVSIADKQRRIYEVFYTSQELDNHQWKAVTASLSALAESEKLWLVNDVQSTWDWKRNAGASQIVSRSQASAIKKAPPFIETNVTPLCLNVGTQQIYFLPDRIYIYRSQKYVAIGYDSIRMAAGVTDFRESGSVPSDAQQVGQTWRFVNKDGSPDRRFSDNRPVPILKYGVLHVELSSELRLTLQLSYVQAAASALERFQSAQLASKQNEQAQQKYRHQSPPPPPPPRQPKPEPLSNCYSVLNLNPSCTQNEASSAYRNLAKQYHPDMVSHLAPEFREMAEQKMRDFNNAYAELKRIKGW